MTGVQTCALPIYFFHSLSLSLCLSICLSFLFLAAQTKTTGTGGCFENNNSNTERDFFFFLRSFSGREAPRCPLYPKAKSKRIPTRAPRGGGGVFTGHNSKNKQIRVKKTRDGKQNPRACTLAKKKRRGVRERRGRRGGPCLTPFFEITTPSDPQSARGRQHPSIQSVASIDERGVEREKKGKD